jgi:trehalose/maltose hydrolase-like predicted phosphorylase
LTAPAARAPHPIRASAPDPSFILTAEDPANGLPPFIGNGSFSLVATPLGTSPAQSYAAGVYDRADGDVPRIAVLPGWNTFNVSHGRGWLNDAALDTTTLQQYRQTLDMYQGLLLTSYVWQDGANRTSVDVLAFVSRAHPDIAVVQLRLVPEQSGRIRVAFPLHDWPPPERLPLGRLEELPTSEPRPSVWYPGHLAVRQRDSLSLGLQVDGGTTRVAITQLLPDPQGVRNVDRSGNEIAFDAMAGEPVVLTKFVGVTTSRDGSDPMSRAVTAVRRAAAIGSSTTLAEHVAAWKELWETDVIVEGDERLQRMIHAMLFYLLSSVRENSAESVAPMGLSSAGYYGHIFWDADTWMFPALVLMHPEMARSIVAFRSRTLAAAQRNATDNGYRGAMYPWEADERGDETTPRFAAQNARGEVHVTGDVALAQWQFYLATGDGEWLAREGYPVIKETAEFWVSRVTLDRVTGRYHIGNVVAVDESMIGIDDDAYTNAVARLNLEIATAASLKLGLAPDPDWRTIAEGLHIPYDAGAGRHRTHERASAQTRSSAVPLLVYPLAVPMSEREKRTDLLHTLQQLGEVRKGAMMSHVLYPVVAAELGDEALVDRLLPTTYEGYVRGPFVVLSERPVNDAVNFLTGAGAFLQQVIFGYSGLRFDDSGLRPAFKPLLPSGIERLLLRNFTVRGMRYDIAVERGGVHFKPKLPLRDRGTAVPA